MAGTRGKKIGFFDEILAKVRQFLRQKLGKNGLIIRMAHLGTSDYNFIS